MKYFIVTGSSKGLGEGIAMALLDEGHHLFCISRSESDELRSMAAARNCPVNFVLYDLSVTHGIPQLCQMVFEQVDTSQSEGIYLINNAGVIDPIDRVEACETDRVDIHMRVNILAPMILTAEFIKAFGNLPIQKRIMNISSKAGLVPIYGWSSYCTGKSALNMFSQCTALEQEDQPYPVEVMAVAPGIIDTNMQTIIRGTTDIQFKPRQKFVDYWETGQLIPPTLAGKRLAALLVSEEFSNGEIIDLRST